jgi:hypothetical protein
MGKPAPDNIGHRTYAVLAIPGSPKYKARFYLTIINFVMVA